MHDVIIIEEDFESTENSIKNACEEIEHLIDKYADVIQLVSNTAIIKGETAEAFKSYLSYVKKLKELISPLKQYHTSVNNSFLNAIDDADSYLY